MIEADRHLHVFFPEWEDAIVDDILVTKNSTIEDRQQTFAVDTLEIGHGIGKWSYSIECTHDLEWGVDKDFVTTLTEMRSFWGHISFAAGSTVKKMLVVALRRGAKTVYQAATKGVREIGHSV